MNVTGRPATAATDYCAVRSLTERLAAPLGAEDQTVQSMPDVSPTKWHRAHTTWFFETFVLEPLAPGYSAFDEQYRVLFNSYYEAVGPRSPRTERGLITRPGIEEVARYRRHVDEHVLELLDGEVAPELADARRARPPPRAAAPGAAGDGHRARAVAQPAAPGLRPAAVGGDRHHRG